MEAFAILVGLTVLVAVLMGPIFGLVAWLAGRENRRRLKALEEAMANLEGVVRSRKEPDAGMSSVPSLGPPLPRSSTSSGSEVPEPSCVVPETPAVALEPFALSRAEEVSAGRELVAEVSEGEPGDSPE